MVSIEGVGGVFAVFPGQADPAKPGDGPVPRCCRRAQISSRLRATAEGAGVRVNDMV